jgi:hypothetical protein
LETNVVGSAYLTPVSVLERPDGTEELFPHLISDRQKPGLIAVNSRGQRFVNEACSYHDFVLGMYGSSEDTRSIPAYLVCDSTFVRKYGLGLVRPRTIFLSSFLKAKYLHKGNTILTGTDPDFGKGSTAYNRHLGDPTNQPNACLAQIDRPPFYAVRVWPGDLGTAIGLKVDGKTRVLGAGGSPIPSLYACGSDMSSVVSGTYPGAGITLGPALTFAYVCGKTILEQSSDAT